jgi:pyroglutamyl-peptidase
MAMNRILIFSFKPFLKYTSNSGTVLAKETLSIMGKPSDIKHTVLPVVFEKAGAQLLKIVKSVEPSVVLGLGMHARASHLYFERIALNISHSPVKDNDRNRPRDQIINPDGPLAYQTTLPYNALEEICRKKKLPFRLSFHAGTYVCNNVLYMLVDWLARESSPARAGFLHVPRITTKAKGKLSLMAMSLVFSEYLSQLSEAEL